MKSTAIAAGLLLFAAGAQAADKSSGPLASEAQRTSYAIGIDVGQSDHFAVLVARKRIHKTEGAASGTDAAHTNSFTRDRFSRCIRRHQRCGTCHTNCRRGQKFTTLHGWDPYFLRAIYRSLLIFCRVDDTKESDGNAVNSLASVATSWEYAF